MAEVCVYTDSVDIYNIVQTYATCSLIPVPNGFFLNKDVQLVSCRFTTDNTRWFVIYLQKEND